MTDSRFPGLASPRPTRVVIADADPAAARDLKARLEGDGYRVDSLVHTCEQVLALAEGDGRPDLALVNVRLVAGEGGGKADALETRLAIPVAYLTDGPCAVAPGGVASKSFSHRDIRVVIEVALDRHRTEQQVRDQQLLFTAALAGTDTAEVLTRRDGTVVFLNPAAERLVGWSLADARGRPVEAVAHVRDGERSPAESPLRAAMRDRAVVPLGRRANLVSANRTGVPLCGSAYPVLGAGGELIGGVLTFADATAPRSMTQAALDLAGVLAASQDAVLLLDGQGRITRWNPAAERLFGYTAEEVVGRHAHLLASPGSQDEIDAILSRVSRSSPSHDFAARLARKDKTVVEIDGVGAAVAGEAGAAALAVVVRDTRTVRTLEEQFRQAQKMDAVGRLAGGVAHDFNNLLTVICGWSNLLLEEADPDDPRRDMLVGIRDAGNRAANITRQLLAVSRRNPTEPTVLDLNAVVSGAKNFLERVVGEDIAFSVALDPDLDRVRADPTHLEQALLNLVVNARDAMPRGGTLTVTTANAVAGVPPGRYACLSVADTGTGMTDDVKARVFEPFFSTKGPDRGTGLGLVVVHGFVTRSGGHIAVDTTVGAGTTFRLSLPAALDTRGASVAADTARLPPARASAETVLVVEDDASVRRITRAALESRGYQVLEAGDGDEAVSVAGRHPGPIHLLLTDVVMPGRGGRQTAEAIGRLRPGVKVLYMSGHFDDVMLRKGVAAGGEALLRKPFTPSVLLKRVRAVLGG